MITQLTRTLAVTLKSYPEEWTKWWAERTQTQRFAPLVFVLVYWSLLLLLNGFRSDHISGGLVILVGSYGGRGLNHIYKFLLPILATAIVYDSQRFYGDYIRGPVHVEEPYFFDLRWFGIETATGRLTPNEWFQLHTNPILDLITGFFYISFVPIFAAIGAYFYFWASRTGTPKLSADRIQELAPRYMWSFFWVNLIGYTTYYWYAAAPPWYVALHGFGPAKMDTLANAAGCVRFDELLGTKFFTEWYGRSADVFGAIPSLHVAYPLQAVYFAFKFGRFRAFSIFFYVTMCFAAVYLNHHYILDVLLGSLYAVVITCALERYLDRVALQRKSKC
ncbi:MAG: hypothetical protein A2070_14320 [Bdellovibrionales bacterium GWC1_52_8]|nr:MAG: hypothetical protein A2Z97_11315 [Bdellovibrionales bacterium GWB1_52_6]OFZ02873.1 MAG: hypothetical protein A2X97_04690 [Bdellovibrionales bacterium GWA1_52_35]OFZ33754.1 MAG: hypothetical protein A2070_14320 [Bdellovibrionales bacterium GWC1_52_8]HCM38456.1 hypothetical protein [Bdellovibrionales bacterium]